MISFTCIFWHYLAVKKLSALLHGITSKHDSDFYWLFELPSFLPSLSSSENKLKSYGKVCQNKDFCGIAILSEKDKILKFNTISSKIKCHASFSLTLSLWFKKIDDCESNPDTSSTVKIGEYIPWGY